MTAKRPRPKTYKFCEVKSPNGDVNHFPLEKIPGAGPFTIDIPSATSVRIVRMTERAYWELPVAADAFPD